MIPRKVTSKHVTPELIRNAYHQGLFPMANERGEIGFYAFDKRGVIPLEEDKFVIRRSLRQALKKSKLRVTFDSAPYEVLQACSRIGEAPSYELWLSDELIDHYMSLFRMGSMHTLEVWQDSDVPGEEPQLVGGLYGLAFGAAFCGDSMFSRVPFASQIALVRLVEHLRKQGFILLDAQMTSDHLKQFGQYGCSQTEYMDRFKVAALRTDVVF